MSSGGVRSNISLNFMKLLIKARADLPPSSPQTYTSIGDSRLISLMTISLAAIAISVAPLAASWGMKTLISLKYFRSALVMTYAEETPPRLWSSM